MVQTVKITVTVQDAEQRSTDMTNCLPNEQGYMLQNQGWYSSYFTPPVETVDLEESNAPRSLSTFHRGTSNNTVLDECHSRLTLLELECAEARQGKECEMSKI